MPQIKITEQEAEDLFMEECSERFEIVKSGKWTSDHKYQRCTSIIKEIATGKHYSASMSRSGSYHSDYETYYDLTLTEVKPYEKTIIDWQPVD